MKIVLIILVHASILSSGDSVSLTKIEGFSSIESCKIVGEEIKGISKNTFKDTKFKCVVVK